LTFKPHPLEATDNAISSNNFINQLSANPIQPFVMTIFEGSERVIDFTDSKIALDYACRDLGRDATCREHIAAKPSPWRNIIIIAQEGNTAERLTREGHTKGLLPNLDRLIGEGRYYENAYASSTQTCYGLYSLVTSLPPYPNLHPLKDGVQRSLETVYEQVYSRGEMTTLFFNTHHPDFDDMNVFIPMQGFERLISKQDYNFATNKTWGVDDHIMYDYALQEIDRQWSEGNDVAAVLLSCSNHRPFNAPTVEGFTPKSTDPEEEAIEYADWAMNRFLEMAKGREWFDHTLFVITSDHGRTVSEDYIINESIFHIPLLFYSPKHIEPEVRSDLVAQVDITPTAFSMLGKEFDNRTMGIDLTSRKRDYAVMTSAGIIACRSKRWLYAFNPETEEKYLYDLEAEIDSRLTNHAAEHRDIVEAMHKHATKTIQAGWDIHNTPTTIE
jgi:phosphoglycerol transferase MdoB-like AlkP superfamily enzyme